MRRAYALSEEEFCRAEAELELAVSLGLIGQAGFDALEQRRLQKNEENRRKKAAGEVFYGPMEVQTPKARRKHCRYSCKDEGLLGRKDS